MRKAISTLTAIAAALSFATFVPVANAGQGRHMHGNNHHANHGGHHGRGHWHNGQWIALGVGAAIVGAAVASDRGCYWRYGHRYCD